MGVTTTNNASNAISGSSVKRCTMLQKPSYASKYFLPKYSQKLEG